MIDKWYDRHTRSWVIQLKDESGYQIGNAIYVATKEEADREARNMAEIEEKLKEKWIKPMRSVIDNVRMI